MEPVAVGEIIKAVRGTLLGGDENACATGVSIDTRTLKPGDLFFALMGEKSDGHEFADAAIEKGAAGLVVSRRTDVPETGAAVIVVEDTLVALGDLAAYYRSKFDVKVIGVTGSVGKTTTKEMIASILEKKHKVLKNEMNFNNEIGVPLTLFKLERGHGAAVVEMAMRGPGEVRRLAEIARPAVGVITNVGLSHIERLGSRQAIADAKGEILDLLPKDNGFAVLNAEDEYFASMSERFGGRVVSFGACETADVSASEIEAAENGCYGFRLATKDGSIDITLPTPGYHNVHNALAAAAAAVGMDIDLETIRAGLESFVPPAMRMELIKTKGRSIVLNDSYNASPASMTAAIKTLKSLKGNGRKIAVLGDMLELGEHAERSHYDMGTLLAEGGIGLLITVGPLAKSIANGAKDAGFPESLIESYADSAEAGAKLKGRILDGDAVLVKGSRGMKMEEIVRVITNE